MTTGAVDQHMHGRGRVYIDVRYTGENSLHLISGPPSTVP